MYIYLYIYIYVCLKKLTITQVYCFLQTYICYAKRDNASFFISIGRN